MALLLVGCKIPVVENLGATQDHFECIDFTDNELLKLDNIPPLPRLRSLVSLKFSRRHIVYFLLSALVSDV